MFSLSWEKGESIAICSCWPTDFWFCSKDFLETVWGNEMEMDVVLFLYDVTEFKEWFETILFVETDIIFWIRFSYYRDLEFEFECFEIILLIDSAY